MEYDYAVLKGIPIMGFLIDEQAPWPKTRMENNAKKQAALAAFKKKVKEGPVGFWASSSDLYGKYPIALGKEIPIHDRPGWVRGDQVADPEVVNELSRLSRENERIRTELEEARAAVEIESHHAAVKTLELLEQAPVKGRIRKKGSTSFETAPSNTLSGLFNSISPSMVLEITDSDISDLISIFFADKLKIDVNQIQVGNFPYPRNWTDAVMADLTALELVLPIEKTHETGPAQHVYKLTDHGKKVMSDGRRARMEAAAEMNKKKES